MEQNTTQFGREIKFGDIQKGQTILLYDKTQNTMHKGEFSGHGAAWNSENKCYFPIYEDDRIWIIEELSIVVVDLLRLNQKPFALYVPTEDCWLSKRVPDVGGPLESHFTNFPSMAKGFSSFSEASEYLRKYLTGRCKVVMLKDCNNA